jgi:signal transduction histidine kinase
VLNEMGKINASLGKYDEAFANYEEVLRYKEEFGKLGIEAEALYNIAYLHTLTQDYGKALDAGKQSLALWRKDNNRVKEGEALNKIGDIYFLLNNLDRAYANYKAALEVYQSIDNKPGIAAAYNSVGVLYYHQKNYKQALANLELGLAIARSSQLKNDLLKSYEYLALVHKALGNFKSALEYKESFVALKDFIEQEESSHKLIERQNQLEVDKIEAEARYLDQLRKEKERELAEQKRTQQFLYAILALIVVVVMLVLYMYLMKRKSNRELKAINATVAAQNLELQNLNATKDKFFSIIGHDLKGPLNSLTSFSNLLINYFDTLSKEEIQTLAKDLDKSLKNLFALLNNLLEWARSQTGNIDFTPVEFDMEEVLQQNRELLTTQAGAKEITILHQPDKPLRVVAHKQSVTTVVRNLVSNAIKFTPAGGAIKLEAQLKNNEVRVAVADTGVGMSKDVMDKLFKLDAKHSTLGTANEKGTGLGLILCKDFVEKNGGRMWVESEEGKGSVFYFTVPASSTLS